MSSKRLILLIIYTFQTQIAPSITSTIEEQTDFASAIEYTTIPFTLDSNLTLTIANKTATTIFATWETTSVQDEEVEYNLTLNAIEALGVCNENCSAPYNLIDTNRTITTKQQWYEFKNLVPYFLYTLQVCDPSECSGEVPEETDSDVPEVPHNFELGAFANYSNQTNTNMTQEITWEIPCASNGVIQEYQLKLNDQEFVVDNATFAYNLIELKAWTNYSISIQTVLINNLSSEAISLTFETPSSYPGKPELVTVQEITSESMLVSWNPPEMPQGIITGYHLTLENYGPAYEFASNCTWDTTEINVTTTELNYNFTNLNAYFNYGVQIATENDFAVGLPSEEITNQTNSKPPGPPILINKTESVSCTTKSSSIELIWESPYLANGPLKEFQIQVSDLRQNITIPYTNSTTYSQIIDDLLESTKYTFKLLGILDDDTEGEFTTTDFEIPDLIPEAPRSGSIEPDSHSFYLTWNEPQSYCQIQNYTIKVMQHPNLNLPNCPAINDTSGSYTNTHNSIEIPAVPNTFYEVTVEANTDLHTSDILAINFTTKTAAPEKVRELKVGIINDERNETYNAAAQISFLAPCQLYGRLEYYQIILIGTRDDYNIDYREFKIFPPEELKMKAQLLPQRNYKVSVSVLTEFNTTSDNMIFKSPEGVPEFGENFSDLVEISTESESATLKLNKILSEVGDISYYALFLSRKNLTDEKFGYWNGSETEWPSNNNVAKQPITEKMWNPFQDGATNIQFKIGGDSNCESDDYCNKPLEEHVQYFLIIRTLTKSTYKDSKAIPFVTLKIASQLALILGTTFASIALVIAIIATILWKRGLIPTQICTLTRGRRSKSSESIELHEDNRKSISVRHYVHFYKSIVDQTEFFGNQFRELRDEWKLTEYPTEFAVLPENIRKNRYTNILPYDSTRVKLLIDEDDELCSDYINASYIKGFSQQVEYIATQGPLPDTCNDFWKMIIQENVTVIVMVTQFVEQNKEKCFKYFPNNYETHKLSENFELRCQFELNFGTYSIRSLCLKKGAQEHNVTHMHFLDWPDFGVPQTSDSLLHFSKQMREMIEKEGGIIAIHCSAGVGRTGTLIALDILMQEIRARTKINIYDTVLNLRTQRTSMVQSQVQYAFLFECINQFLENLNNDKEMEAIYENIGPKEEQIKALT